MIDYFDSIKLIHILWEAKFYDGPIISLSVKRPVTSSKENMKR